MRNLIYDLVELQISEEKAEYLRNGTGSVGTQNTKNEIYLTADLKI